MKRKVWFYLAIALIVITFIESFLLILFIGTSNASALEGSLANEVPYFQLGGIQPACGYIPDANAAARVGGAIIDGVFEEVGHKILPWERGKAMAFVEHDPTLRLWRISKGYIFRGGACVILEQDTGAVVNAWLTK